MNQSYCNDQAYIAESFHLDEDYIGQMSRLSQFKINSYKLSLVKAAFCRTKDELEKNLHSTLLNYTSPAIILADLGFFKSETEN